MGFTAGLARLTGGTVRRRKKRREKRTEERITDHIGRRHFVVVHGHSETYLQEALQYAEYGEGHGRSETAEAHLLDDTARTQHTTPYHAAAAELQLLESTTGPIQQQGGQLHKTNCIFLHLKHFRLPV